MLINRINKIEKYLIINAFIQYKLKSHLARLFLDGNLGCAHSQDEATQQNKSNTRPFDSFKGLK